MYDVGAEVRAILDSGVQPAAARLHALEPDNTIRETWDDAARILISGSVTGDRDAQPRYSSSIELANPSGSLSPQRPGDLFFRGERYRLERGIQLPGNAMFWIPVATLNVTSFSTSMRGRLHVSGSDPMEALDQDFGEVLTLDGAMRGSEAFLAIAEPVLGDGSDWELDDDGRTLGTTRTFPEDARRLQSLVELMTDLGLETYSDRLGDPVLRPLPDPTALPTARTYVQEEGVAWMMELERSGSFKPFNRHVVIGEPLDAPIVRGEWEVTDPSSPIHRDRIGLRTADTFRSAQITTQGVANAVAAARGQRLALVQDAVGGSSVPDHTLDPGDVIAFTETRSGTDDRYWQQSITYPVLTGAMSFDGERVIPLAL